MIQYAHIREVRVHVVINTLIYDDEMDKVMEFVDFLYNNDVDAVIVQDLGVITRIHCEYPDLEIHASTQLNAMTIESGKILPLSGEELL
jgi:putative protease